VDFGAAKMTPRAPIKLWPCCCLSLILLNLKHKNQR
jgi:hypothetical protein